MTIVADGSSRVRGLCRDAGVRLASACGGPAAVRDLVALAAGAGLILAWSSSVDGLELVFEWARRYEGYEVDEILTSLILLPFGSGIFAARRVRELRREMARRDASEARMRHMALHDGLTGLPNRALFGERLAQALAQARRDGRAAAVLLLDLDRFKEVNDAAGRRPAARLREGDRHGGAPGRRRVRRRLGPVSS